MPLYSDTAPRNQGRGAYAVSELSDRATWDDFLLRVRPHTFLQTWQWGEFNRLQGNGILRLGVTEASTGRLVAVALVVDVSSRRARFLFCPHGPVWADPAAVSSLPAVVTHLKSYARSRGISFIRFSTMLPDTIESRSVFRQLHFRNAPIHMHPELAWMLDITPSGEQLLSGMRKTMRQLIRKSETLGVSTSMGNDDGARKEFLRLYHTTAQRQHFVGFSEAYLRDEMAAFGDDAKILFARHGGNVLAGAVVIFTPYAAFYHHGASIPTKERVPAAYLLQWAAIVEAKRRGLPWYNFWGIAPDGQSRHPWAGLTAFKKGFGGFSEAYLHAQDLPLQVRYIVNYIVERARRARRGL